MIHQDELAMLVIPSMNDTHLEEMMLINKLDTTARARDMAGISVILQELIDHTAIHFSQEEKIMTDSKFPDFDIHKAEHDRHLHELKTWKKYFEKVQDPKAVWIHIEGNLARWTMDHVETMDKAMALHSKENS